MSNSSNRSSKPETSTWTKGLRGLLGGRIGFGQATREAFRRGRAAARSRRERALLDDLASQSVRLRPEFQLNASDLLKHFREPFVIGGRAVASVLSWENTRDRDHVVAEHNGYERLPKPVRHRRAITFDKANRWWLVEDELIERANTR